MKTTLEEILQTFNYLLEKKNRSPLYLPDKYDKKTLFAAIEEANNKKLLTSLQEAELKSITQKLEQSFVGKELSVVIRVVDVLDDHIEGDINNGRFSKIMKRNPNYDSISIYGDLQEYVEEEIFFYNFSFVFGLLYQDDSNNRFLELSVKDYLKAKGKISKLLATCEENFEGGGVFYLKIYIIMNLDFAEKSTRVYYTINDLSLTPDEMIVLMEKRKITAKLNEEKEEQEKEKRRQEEIDYTNRMNVGCFIASLIGILLLIKMCN